MAIIRRGKSKNTTSGPLTGSRSFKKLVGIPQFGFEILPYVNLRGELRKKLGIPGKGFENNVVVSEDGKSVKIFLEFYFKLYKPNMEIPGEVISRVYTQTYSIANKYAKSKSGEPLYVGNTMYVGRKDSIIKSCQKEYVDESGKTVVIPEDQQYRKALEGEADLMRMLRTFQKWLTRYEMPAFFLTFEEFKQMRNNDFSPIVNWLQLLSETVEENRDRIMQMPTSIIYLRKNEWNGEARWYETLAYHFGPIESKNKRYKDGVLDWLEEHMMYINPDKGDYWPEAKIGLRWVEYTNRPGEAVAGPGEEDPFADMKSADDIRQEATNNSILEEEDDLPF